MLSKKRDVLISFRGEKTQVIMANKYGVTQQAWWKYENGKATPSYELMEKIANDIGKSINEIFFDTNNNHMELKGKTRQRRNGVRPA